MSMPTKPEAGIKHDDKKLPMELLAPDAIEGLVAVLKFGAFKYTRRNWEGGLAWGRLVGAILRHTFTFLAGKDLDEETGLPIVDHILCEAMFLSAMFRRRKDLDNRPVTKPHPSADERAAVASIAPAVGAAAAFGYR